MNSFPFLHPTADEPEVVHETWRAASLCWNKEKVALLELADAVEHKAPFSVMRAREANLSHAEDKMDAAIVEHIHAIRGTRFVPDPAGTTDDATHQGGMQCYDADTCDMCAPGEACLPGCPRYTRSTTDATIQ